MCYLDLPLLSWLSLLFCFLFFHSAVFPPLLCQLCHGNVVCSLAICYQQVSYKADDGICKPETKVLVRQHSSFLVICMWILQATNHTLYSVLSHVCNSFVFRWWTISSFPFVMLPPRYWDQVMAYVGWPMLSGFVVEGWKSDFWIIRGWKLDFFQN